MEKQGQGPRRQIIYRTPRFFREKAAKEVPNGDYVMAYGEWQDAKGNLLAICVRATAIAGNRGSLCDFEVEPSYLHLLVSVRPGDVPALWLADFRAFLA